MMAILKQDSQLLRRLLLPLHASDQEENRDIVSLVNRRGWHGHSVLHLACMKHDAVAISILLDAGADPRQVNDAGVAPWQLALWSQDLRCMSLLVVGH